MLLIIVVVVWAVNDQNRAFNIPNNISKHSWNEKSKFILSLVLAENTKDLVAFLLNTHTQVNVLSLGCILLTSNTTTGVLQKSQQYSSQIVETDTVSLKFSRKILRFILHTVFPPEMCLLPPQCWTTRIWKHWDHCDTQINIGEGETDTSVSRFLMSIAGPGDSLLSSCNKEASVLAKITKHRALTFITSKP